MSKDDSYVATLLKETRDQNKAVLEAVRDMQLMVIKIYKIEEKLAVIESDLKVVKAAVTDTSKKVHAHERRIATLETAN